MRYCITKNYYKMRKSTRKGAFLRVVEDADPYKTDSGRLG